MGRQENPFYFCFHSRINNFGGFHWIVIYGDTKECGEVWT